MISYNNIEYYVVGIILCSGISVFCILFMHIKLVVWAVKAMDTCGDLECGLDYMARALWVQCGHKLSKNGRKLG